MPLVATVEDVVHQALGRALLRVDEAGAAHRLGGGRHREEEVLGARLDEHRAWRDERAEILVLEPAQHAEEDLRAAHVPGHLVAVGPRREVAADHRGRHAVVDGGGEERDRAPVGDADHAEARRVDERVLLQHVEAAPQVPDVLGQRVPPRHGGVHQVGVARVVVLGIPVEPLAEAAQVGRQHDVAPAGQLERVVGVGHVGVLEPDHLRLARPVAVAGEDGRSRRPALALVGHQQVGRHRHGVLGVEDDLVPPVAVAGDRLEGLDVERHRLGLGPEQLGQAGTAAPDPGRAARPGRPRAGGPRGRWRPSGPSTGTRASSCGPAGSGRDPRCPCHRSWTAPLPRRLGAGSM